MSGVQFKKGPYLADDGDFAAAGSANVNYVNRLDRPVASGSGGGQGWGRIFVAASPRVGAGFLLVGMEAAHKDGPWDLADNLQKLNGIVRYSRGDARNGFSITGQGYNADWNATTRFRSGPSITGSSRDGAISIRRTGDAPTGIAWPPTFSVPQRIRR